MSDNNDDWYVRALKGEARSRGWETPETPFALTTMVHLTNAETMRGYVVHPIFYAAVCHVEETGSFLTSEEAEAKAYARPTAPPTATPSAAPSSDAPASDERS